MTGAMRRSGNGDRRFYEQGGRENGERIERSERERERENKGEMRYRERAGTRAYAIFARLESKMR